MASPTAHSWEPTSYRDGYSTWFTLQPSELCVLKGREETAEAERHPWVIRSLIIT